MKTELAFSSALISMERGTKVRRSVWPLGWSISISSEGCQFLLQRPGTQEVWQPCSSDILAHDWIMA